MLVLLAGVAILRGLLFAILGDCVLQCHCSVTETDISQAIKTFQTGDSTMANHQKSKLCCSQCGEGEEYVVSYQQCCPWFCQRSREGINISCPQL